MTPLPLCYLFHFLCCRTWDYLKTGEASGIGIGETALTDINLVDLARHFPTAIFLKKFSQNEEGDATGADWEWWVSDATLTRWRGMRVQAKRISRGRTPSSRRLYSAVNHKGQLRRLIADAEKQGLVPLYCFYNYWPDGDQTRYGVTVPLFTSQQGPVGLDIDLQGCTLASARYIASLTPRDRKYPECVNRRAVPWHWLVCPAPPSLAPYRPTADLVTVVDVILGYLQPTTRHGQPRQGNPRQAPIPAARSQPPPHVREMLQAAGVTDIPSGGPPDSDFTVGATTIYSIAPRVLVMLQQPGLG